MKKILITGASGFIGSFLVEEGLRRGFEVWAAVRSSSSRRYLQDERIRFLEIDLSSDNALRRQLQHHKAAEGAFDAVIHAAGATQARSEADFFRTNAEGTERLARLLLETSVLTEEVGRLVYFSSLSVCGPAREADNQPITDADAKVPNTAYGRSKLAAEQALSRIAGLNYVTLRPTGVYGPREKDYFLMAKAVKRGIDVGAGFKPQVLTFIYVKDLVQAAYAALERGERGAAYFLTDGATYSSRDFSELLRHELGVKRLLHLTVPLWVLRTVCAVAGSVAKVLGRTTTLNADKYNILSQRNWQCDTEPACRDLGYVPQWPLRRGVEETVKWYVENKWL